MKRYAVFISILCGLFLLSLFAVSAQNPPPKPESPKPDSEAKQMAVVEEFRRKAAENESRGEFSQCAENAILAALNSDSETLLGFGPLWEMAYSCLEQLPAIYLTKKDLIHAARVRRSIAEAESGPFRQRQPAEPAEDRYLNKIRQFRPDGYAAKMANYYSLACLGSGTDATSYCNNGIDIWRAMSKKGDAPDKSEAFWAAMLLWRRAEIDGYSFPSTLKTYQPQINDLGVALLERRQNHEK